MKGFPTRVQAAARAAAAALAPAPGIAVEAAGAPVYEVYVGAAMAPADAPAAAYSEVGQPHEAKRRMRGWPERLP